MNLRITGMLTNMTITFILTWPTVAVFAQAETDSVKDRIEIQEKLLYAYAYAYDSKDCESFAGRGLGSFRQIERKGRNTAVLHRPTKERRGEY